MPPTPPMQRKPVAALIVEAVGLMTLRAVVVRLALRLRLRLSAAGDERGEAIHVAVVVRARCRAAMLRTPAMLLLRFPLPIALVVAGLMVPLLVFALLVFPLLIALLMLALLFAWGKELRVPRQIGLRIAGAEGRLLAGADDRLSVRLVLAIVEVVVARIGRAAAATLGSISERLGLPELVLRRGDQTKIMFRVLKIVLRRHRVAG